MRIRCSKGLRISAFHGHFFIRSTDLLALPQASCSRLPATTALRAGPGRRCLTVGGMQSTLRHGWRLAVYCRWCQASRSHQT